MKKKKVERKRKKERFHRAQDLPVLYEKLKL